MPKTIILGAGVAGLACAKALGGNAIVLEKENRVGGLCDSFEMNGFYFDYGAHAAFSKNKEIVSLFESSTEVEKSLSEAINYKKGNWVKQPVQNNLAGLPIEERIHIIKDFVQKEDKGDYQNYGEWLVMKYGDYFARNYPFLYTRKYWTVNPDCLETKWIGSRMYTPSLDEILMGSYTKETPNVHYAGEIRYPVSGGFSTFLQNLQGDYEIITEADIEKIDTQEKTIIVDGKMMSYDNLVSTIPLPELIHLLNDVPPRVLDATGGLNYTSLVIVSLGINKKNVMPKGTKCIYIYDEDIYTARVSSTSQYGSENAPPDCTSLQAEIYFSKFKKRNDTLEQLMYDTIEHLVLMNLFKKEDVVVSDVREKEYANIIFTDDIYNNRRIVHEYLDGQNIMYAGRFGMWDYLWSDQSIQSGVDIAHRILERE